MKHDITVRQMDFSFPEVLDPVVIPGKPEESFFLVSLSLMLPYLEPYLIRTMKAAKKVVDDPDLVHDLEQFSAQEGQHFRQHARFNAAIRRNPIPGLDALEAELDADYRRFSAEKPLRWNLAYAEGFEALTTAVALSTFEQGLDPATHPAVRDVYTWHLIEELEHRTVAFDVYEHVHGRYAYRLAVGAWAQWHMARWLGKVIGQLIAAEPRMETVFGGEAGRKARSRGRLGELRRRLLPKVLRTYSPFYTPHRIAFTDTMKQLSHDLSEQAVRTS